MTTQLENILTALQNADGGWVCAFTLHEASGSLCVHSRIADLRKQGYVIENQSRREKGRCISEYRLAAAPTPTVLSKKHLPVNLAQPELIEAAPRIWPD